MLLSNVIEILRLIRLFGTPYPYIAIVCALALFIILMGVLLSLRLKTLTFMWDAISMAIVGAAVFIGGAVAFDTPSDTPKLDGKTVKVIGYSWRGLRVEGGTLVVPAGCAFVSRANRHAKNPIPAMKEFVAGRKVTLNWSDDMEGYLITNKDGLDMSVFMVSSGLARTKSLASDELMALEREARDNKIGIWEKPWRGVYPGIDYTLATILGIVALLLSFVATFMVYEYCHIQKEC